MTRPVCAGIPGWSSPPSDLQTPSTELAATLVILLTRIGGELSCGGWQVPQKSIDPHSLELQNEFRRACWFLTHPADRHTSYTLKHVAEHAARCWPEHSGCYICHGVFILALLHVGYIKGGVKVLAPGQVAAWIDTKTLPEIQ